MHILIIEDQPKLADNIRKFLELERYTASVANDGLAGMEIAMTQTIDLIILDVNLPGMDGYAICTALRERGKNMPILMLTARTKREEVVHGLNLGADDYLSKPFDLDELLARVRALLRRQGQGEKKPVLSIGDIALDTNTREVHKDGRKIELSPKEFALLEFLVSRKGLAQDRTQILSHVWGDRDDLLFSQTVDVHIAYLRRKLGKDIIRTVPGTGYMIPADA
jgi:two-component system, OmpR family, response regulator